MFCVKCGKELKEGVKFCTNCGQEVTKGQEEVDDKLTYSQNKAIETSSNTPVATTTNTNTDGKATASLVLGIVSFFIPCCNLITAIIGLILGIVSKERSGKRTAGIILNSIVIGLMLIFGVLAFTTGFIEGYSEELRKSKPTTPSIIEKYSNDSVETGKKFNFDDFEITVGNNYSFTTVDNSYSNYNEKEVVKLPVTIKNISSSSTHLNMFYHSATGPEGTTLPKLGAMFDDSLDYAPDLAPSETYTKYMYLLYEGNGKYVIKFDNYKENKTLEISIRK